MLEFQVNEVQAAALVRDAAYYAKKLGRPLRWQPIHQIDLLPKEEWRPVPGFEGLYMVSSEGRFMALAGRRGCRRNRILRTSNSRGYRQVTLSNGGKKVRQSAHTIVCTVFHGQKPSPRHQVAHGDGLRSNNREDNLRWATGKENQADRKLHGTDIRGEKCHLAKLTARKVRAIKRALLLGASVHKCCKKYDVVESTIKSIRAGRTWGHVTL